ncbi:hypothetical protein [Oleidesulfovibrio sp.]|uniref:baseplate complex protein n=1 Tax=Oleidesulfovibrio sp. TaxID=2909707 RepID=UPI003A87A446
MSKFLMLDDYSLPGFGLMVQGSLQIKNEDLSGETSSTSTVNKGVKPKEFTVSLRIGFDAGQQLKQLTAKAEAKDNGGRMRVYACVCHDASCITPARPDTIPHTTTSMTHSYSLPNYIPALSIQ